MSFVWAANGLGEVAETSLVSDEAVCVVYDPSQHDETQGVPPHPPVLHVGSIYQNHLSVQVKGFLRG